MIRSLFIGLPLFALYIGVLGLSIYVLILSIKFLKVGTKAFEIYIKNNNS